MKRRHQEPNLRVLYLLLVGVGGILAHLASEFGAMGAGAEHLVFSARHLYLGLAVLVGIGLLLAQCRAFRRCASSAPDLKRMVHAGLQTLPFSGKGIAFYLVTAGVQFGVGMSTEFGEGAPIAGHDVAAGILGSLCVVILLALFARALASSLPRIVEALSQIVPVPDRTSSRARAGQGTPPIAWRFVWFTPLFNRPPPSLPFVTQTL
ncbi:MAG TPA: hypothetical protein VKR99_08755 [Candidatus Eremiobacteraceae bacterium]|nr:hypothetical protein [Candidatus Eremiobacteraceae bacterium]